MISQSQTQRQQLKILPQQIQLLNLYFLNTMELEQRINKELEENPLLELNEDKDGDDKDQQLSKDAVQDYQGLEEYMYDDIPDYKAEYQNYFNSEDAPAIPIVSTTNFKEEAKQQLRLVEISDDDYTIAAYMIDMLSSRGLMDKPLDEVADDLSFNQQMVVEVADLERILKVIQKLEPVGIGARSIQECLLFQLEKMNIKRPDIRCAYLLVRDHFNDLMHRQFEKLVHALGIDEEELRIVLNMIGNLNFYPVSENSSSIEPKNTIIPDFVITRDGETLQVNLLNSRSNAVFVNQTLYDQLAGQCSKKDKTTVQYVKSKLQSAQWFVSAVKQREETMLRIMQIIVRMQIDYFMEGDIRLLRPMVLRNVAAESGYDISTISRITSNKYADTHFGQVLLKDLFSEGIADKKGEVISNKVIQSVIEEAISGENRKSPYTDQQLVHILTSKGYNIARRTVAKYREQMQIPIAQIRAVWA